MNKDNFLKTLESSLKHVSVEDKQEMLYDYEEHFRIGIENGEEEEEIAKKLGNPKQLVKELSADYHIAKAQENKSIKNITRAILATLGLGVLNFIFVLGPLLAVLVVYVSLFGGAISLIVSPIIALIYLLFSGFHHVLFEVSLYFAVTSLGVLWSILMIYIGKWLYIILLKYIKFNIQIVKEGN